MQLQKKINLIEYKRIVTVCLSSSLNFEIENFEIEIVVF